MIYFPHNDVNQGYFYYLATNYSSSLRNFVTATPSSTYLDRDIYTIFTNLYDNTHSFLTPINHTTNQWILIELKDGYFSLESYLIVSPDHDKNDYVHLKNWKLFVSANQQKWNLLDSEEGVTSLNDNKAMSNFTCKFNCENYYKYFLLYQSDVGFTGTYGFGVRRIDFFGSIIQYNHIKDILRYTSIYHIKLVSPIFLSVFFFK